MEILWYNLNVTPGGIKTIHVSFIKLCIRFLIINSSFFYTILRLNWLFSNRIISILIYVWPSTTCISLVRSFKIKQKLKQNQLYLMDEKNYERLNIQNWQFKIKVMERMGLTQWNWARVRVRAWVWTKVSVRLRQKIFMVFDDYSNKKK